MSCEGLQSLHPVCRVGQAVAGGAAAAADSAFSHIAGYFGTAALSTTTWLWDQIDTATSLDLGSPALAKELAITAAIAGVLCMGLFLIQVITSILRQEPGGLGRAVRGLLISFLGSAFALASAKLLIAATDSLSANVVSYTMGTNIRGVGEKLAFTKLASIQNPALVLIFAIVILCASVMVWAAMMTRKMMILIAAVLAPLAFSGATADITRNWVRRWIEFTAAMIVSKLLLVIILSVGVSILNGAGQDGNAPTQAFTQLAAGSLILLTGGLAPWIAIRMFHFAGDSLYSAHATVAQGSAGARSIVAAPQKVSSAQWQARSLASSMRGRPAWGGGPAGPGRAPVGQQTNVDGAPAQPTTGASVTTNPPATAEGNTAPPRAGGSGAGLTSGSGDPAARTPGAGADTSGPRTAGPGGASSGGPHSGGTGAGAAGAGTAGSGTAVPDGTGTGTPGAGGAVPSGSGAVSGGAFSGGAGAGTPGAGGVGSGGALSGGAGAGAGGVGSASAATSPGVAAVSAPAVVAAGAAKAGNAAQAATSGGAHGAVPETPASPKPVSAPRPPRVPRPPSPNS